MSWRNGGAGALYAKLPKAGKGAFAGSGEDASYRELNGVFARYRKADMKERTPFGARPIVPGSSSGYFAAPLAGAPLFCGEAGAGLLAAGGDAGRGAVVAEPVV